MPSQAQHVNQLVALPSTNRVPGILRHLTRLSGALSSGADKIAYIHVYAQPSDTNKQSPLHLIRAAESGPEGIACVDDAARAALLALQVYQQLRAPAAREWAHAWLGFVAYMQESDGRFTNFIVDRTGRKNRRGRTSYAGGPWWSARAFHALAAGWRLTGDAKYLQLLERSRVAYTTNLKVTAIQALAYMDWYAVQPTDVLRRRIHMLCDRIVASGAGYFRDRKGRDSIPPWGYHQLQAVAQAGRLFSRPDYLAACEYTVQQVIEPLTAREFRRTTPWQRAPLCVYDLSTIMLGLEELYTATRQDHYCRLALVCADWLYGKNPGGHALYNPQTGRCADGVAEGQLSPNCGAESAVEAGFMELARQRLLGGKDHALGGIL